MQNRNISQELPAVQIKIQKSLKRLSQQKKQILKESLKNIDCLKPQIQPQEQYIRILRDTLKYLEICKLQCQEVIYQSQITVNFLFFVLEGRLNLNHKHLKENKTLCEGNIFGQKQCIEKIDLQYEITVQSKTCIIGKIYQQDLKQIISLFHQRQLSKKVQMLRNCPLFVNFRKHYIENVAQNSISQKLKLGQIIFKQGQKVQTLFLIIQGEIQLDKHVQIKNKIRQEQKIFLLPKVKAHQNLGRKNIQTVISKGQFIGDYQIWSKSQFKYKATCITQEAFVLKFNCLLIEGLLSEDDLLQSSPFYQLKNSYIRRRAESFAQFKSRQKVRIGKTKPIELSPEQKQIKSKIMARYVQKNPTMIDKLSPIQIEKIIKKRTKKLKTQSAEQSFLMMQSLIKNSSLKKKRSQSRISNIRSENYFSPQKIKVNRNQSQRKQEKNCCQRSEYKFLIIGIKSMQKNNQHFTKQKTSLRTRQIKQIMGGVQNHEVRQLSLRMQRNRRNSNF